MATEMPKKNEEATCSEKDYLLERGKLFSELFTQFGRQHLENEETPQAEQKRRLIGLFSKCFESKESENHIKQRKDETDDELVSIEIRVSKYWPYILLSLLAGAYLLVNTVLTLLLVNITGRSVCWNFFFSGLSFLAPVVFIKGLKLCLQDWSLRRQGKFIGIYLFSFIVVQIFSESFGILTWVLIKIQVN